jgi:hypothetical protein
VQLVALFSLATLAVAADGGAVPPEAGSAAGAAEASPPG